jgi:acyl-CoA synthetase (NDP forming)/RimJ/RimL family protein N-acetyltransferase
MAAPETADRWTSTVVLGNGDTAVIRPIAPSDGDTLRAFHERQSSESRYRRFFSPKVTLSDAELERFTTVDFVDRAAFVIEEHGEFIGWASYERWPNRNDAEVAFMVDDQHQGKGAATLMLEHLAAVAQHNGISRFTAETLADNRPMLDVFAKAGWPLQRRFDSGVIDVDFPIDETSDFIDSVERREQRADSRAMARLLLPSSIAVIGASEERGSVGRELWVNAVRTASCPVYAVNPNRREISGRKTYASVTDIPDEVGLAVIAVPAAALEQTIDECIEKRVRGAVVLTVTGDSVDADGLVTRARRNGLRIVGPASMGIATPRPEIGLGAALADIRGLADGTVAISMQSGTLGSSLLRLAGTLGVGLSWFVSLGDKRDVSANDLLQFWEDDDATSVIALYTESFGNPRKFARIARRVARSKPIVAVRTGAALIGAGNDAIYHQSGVIEVPTVPALLDTARVLANQPLMSGRRVALLSNARSPAVAARATLEAAGLVIVDRPEGLHWNSRGPDYRAAIGAAVDDDGVDAVLVIHAPPVRSEIDGPAPDIDAATEHATKPLVAVMLGSGDGPLRPGSMVPSFAFPEQAAAVLGRIATYSEWRREEEAAAGEATPDSIDPTAAGELIAEHLAAGTMPPESVRQLLAAYGVTMTTTRTVATEDPDAVAAAAASIGYPVAIKARRRHTGRSAEAGVALDLTDDEDVIATVRTMREHLGDDADEVLVQAMLPPGVDLRVRVTVDDRIGPILAAGLGGAQADAIADVVTRLVPISPSAARGLITGTRAGSVLDDDEIELATDLITRVGQLASDHVEIAELDLNPVIVGDHAIAVADAEIVLREPVGPEHAVRRLE